MRIAAGVNPEQVLTDKLKLGAEVGAAAPPRPQKVPRVYGPTAGETTENEQDEEGSSRRASMRMPAPNNASLHGL